MARVPESFHIQTIPGYKTGDGSQFHSLAEAQAHTRRHLLGRIYDDACAIHPTFAKLDRDLFIEINYVHGSKIGATMDDPLQPRDRAIAVPPVASNVRTAAEQTRDTLDQALRPIRSMPRTSVNDPLADPEAAAIAARFRPRDTEQAPLMGVDEAALARELGRAAL